MTRLEWLFHVKVGFCCSTFILRGFDIQTQFVTYIEICVAVCNIYYCDDFSVVTVYRLRGSGIGLRSSVLSVCTFL